MERSHWAAPDENDSHFSERLSFLKASYKIAKGHDSHHFEPIEGVEFQTLTATGILSLKDHFCLICIACEKSGPQEERINKSCYAMLWEGEVEDSIQQFRIVVMYAVPSWKQVGSFKNGTALILLHSHTCPICVLHASSTPVRLPRSITYLRKKEDGSTVKSGNSSLPKIVYYIWE